MFGGARYDLNGSVCRTHSALHVGVALGALRAAP